MNEPTQKQLDALQRLSDFTQEVEQMNATEYYLALDLELNNAEDGSTPNPPIIQVGVAIGTWDHYMENSIITRKWYFDPKEKIFPFITKLTGITDDDVKYNSVDTMSLLRSLVSWLINTNHSSIQLHGEAGIVLS